VSAVPGRLMHSEFIAEFVAAWPSVRDGGSLDAPGVHRRFRSRAAKRRRRLAA
jgi:hypothetical protein